MSEVFISELENFVIEISDDQFSAFLTVYDNNDFINEKELIDLIIKTRITHGFQLAHEMIESKHIQKQPNSPFPLAIGDIPKAPEIEFSPLINTGKCYDPTMESQFDKLKNIQRIEKGEPLAHLFVTKPSRIGMNVFGIEVQPESYESQIIQDYLGENVTYSNERGQIIASKSGYPYMDELPRLHVKSDFKFDKNLSQGFVEEDFFGNMIINGDICDSAKLKINGDLIVHGNITQADIDVKGDITVHGDINNCQDPGIIASGKITFLKAENSKIVAGDTVNFKNHIHFCKVLAENGIYGDEESSAIVGGSASSGENVEVAIIGNTGSISTEIEIAISPYIKEKMLIITKQIVKMKEQKLTAKVEFLNLQDELSNFEMKLEEKISAMLKNMENLPKHIMVYKKVFPGSYIRILKKSKNVTEELNRVSFSIVNNEFATDQF